jgi:hypothetical protein
MNAVPDIDSTDARIQLTELFLRRTRAEVEQMRRNVPRLIEGNDDAWRELQVNARRISSMAAGLEMNLLSTFSRNLFELADRKPAHVSADTQFLLSLTGAIEMVAMELNKLFADLGRRPN